MTGGDREDKVFCKAHKPYTEQCKEDMDGAVVTQRANAFHAALWSELNSILLEFDVSSLLYCFLQGTLVLPPLLKN